jgi:hypothetical protein
VGSAWLIARETGQCELLRPPAGEVPTWQDGDLRWIRARPEWAPDFELHGFGSAAEVDALDGPPEPGRNAYCWAWLDEPAGIARVRVFVPEAGVDEDEATGSGALLLCAHVGREIEIHQGRGSVLHARPAPDGTVDVGGRVGSVGEKPYG